MSAFPSDAELDREKVRREGLIGMLELCWPLVEPDAALILGRHHEEVCRHLMAVSYGMIDRLIINVPPGFTKSILTCIVWPVWDWCYNPGRKFMFASFDQTLTYRDSDKQKEIIESDWYRERWGDLRSDEHKNEDRRVVKDGSRPNTTGVWFNRSGGLRFSTSVQSKATGWHAHIQVADDPNKPHDSKGGRISAGINKKALENVGVWWQGTMASRKSDPQNFSRVIIQQRLHAQDLTGKCIAETEQGWVHLRLPMRFEERSECDCPNCADGGCVTSIGGDWRTVEGELLHPERFDDKAANQTAADMGPIVAAAQLQQNPSPPGGAIVKDDWLTNRFRIDARRMPVDRIVQSWDCTFKDLETSDRVCGQVWGKKGPNFYLLDLIVGKMSFLGTLQAILDLTAKWPRTRGMLIEDKANGSAILQTLRVTEKIPGLIPFNPTGSKLARLEAVTPFLAAGNVVLPQGPAWVSGYVKEMTQFPFSTFDDQVDATSQALLYLTERIRTEKLKNAMANARKGLYSIGNGS